jgi:hypothetical protein
MAYFEVVCLVLVAMTGLVLLALAVASGAATRRVHPHLAVRHPDGPPARPWSRSAPESYPAVPATSARRHSAARCRRQRPDWSRLMDGPTHGTTPVEAER